MTITNSGVSPQPIAASAATRIAAPTTAAAAAPAATVEFSAAARDAQSSKSGTELTFKDPLNIIWGNSPKR